METIVYKRKIIFTEKIYLTVFSLLVVFVVSIHNMIPHTHHGKIFSYIVKSFGEDVECYFNHHSVELIESVEIKYFEWNKTTTILYADTDYNVRENLYQDNLTEKRPYQLYYKSVTVGSVQLRAPPFV